MLWLIKGLGAGGAEQLLVTHARLRSDDYDVSVGITRPDRHHLRPALEASGVDVIDLRGGSHRPGQWIWNLSRLLRNGRYDVIHVHSPALAPPVRLIARLLRIPVVSTEHNRWAQYRSPTRVANALTCRLDTHRFAVSDGVRSSVARPFRDGIEVLHHGIDLAVPPGTDVRARVRRDLGIDDDAVCVIVVANLRREKAPLDFVDAVRRIPRTSNARFLWVGQGPMEQAFRRAIVDSEVADRLRYLGYRDDVVDLLSAADIFALSSHHEGLPVAIMEAKAAGLPVVATRVGGLPEVIEGPVPSGLLVDPGHPEQLAEALRRVIDDHALRTSLAKASLESAAGFDARRAIARIESVYRQVA